MSSSSTIGGPFDEINPKPYIPSSRCRSRTITHLNHRLAEGIYV